MSQPPDDSLFFREATLRVTGSLHLEDALRDAFDYLSVHLPLDVLSVHYYDPQRQAAYSLASHSAKRGSEDYDESPLFSMAPEEMDRFRRAGASVNPDHPVAVYNERGTDPIYLAFARFLRAHGLTAFSSILLRLDIESDYQGVLQLATDGHGAYTVEHARLAKLVEEPFAIAVSNARRYRETVRLSDELAEDNRAMHRDLEVLAGDQVIGADLGLRPVMELVRQVAPMSSPVLLMGETGTGKEVIANAIHSLSPRHSRPFVRMQCGAVPETLLDSELFGHEKGAFTGAVQSKRGRFERADEGTLFFDEIGELTLDAQVKLLQVLQSMQFERVGGSHTLQVDVRVIAATNRHLHEEVREGRFREDLWYRLNVFPIHLPPVRQRKEDIPSLVHWLTQRKCNEMGVSAPPELAEGALDQLLAYDWPGNVRELQNVIERALILCHGGPLRFPPFDAAQHAETDGDSPAPTHELASLDSVISEHIRRALRRAGGRVEGSGGAADLLGLRPSTLRARMRKLDIPFGRRAIP